MSNCLNTCFSCQERRSGGGGNVKRGGGMGKVEFIRYMEINIISYI